MELDEFLSENGLPMATAEPLLNKELSKDEAELCQKEAAAAAAALPTEDKPVSPVSPTPVEREPSPVQVDVNFDLSPTDVALATIPGQDIYVPLEAKDEKYWDRRRKNNIAAKQISAGNQSK